MGRHGDFRPSGFDTIGTEDSFDLCPVRRRTLLDLDPEDLRSDDSLFSLDQLVPVHLPATWLFQDAGQSPSQQGGSPLPHVHREEHPTLIPIPEDPQLCFWNAGGDSKDSQLKSLENKLELLTLHRSVSALKCEMFLDFLEEQQARPPLAQAQALARGERSGRGRRHQHMQQRFPGQADKGDCSSLMGDDVGGGSGGSEAEPAYGSQVVTPPHAFMWGGLPPPNNGYDERAPHSRHSHSSAAVRRSASFKSLPFVESPGHPMSSCHVSSTGGPHLGSGEAADGFLLPTMNDPLTDYGSCHPSLQVMSRDHSSVTAAGETVPGGSSYCLPHPSSKPHGVGEGPKGSAAAAAKDPAAAPALPFEVGSSNRPRSPMDPLQEMCVPYALTGVPSMRQARAPGTLEVDDSCVATFNGGSGSTQGGNMGTLFQSSSTSDGASTAGNPPGAIQGGSRRYTLNQQMMSIAGSPPSSDQDSCTSEESPISYQGTVAHRRSSFAGCSLQKQSSFKSPMAPASVMVHGRASFDGSRSERYTNLRRSRGGGASPAFFQPGLEAARGASPEWAGQEVPDQSPFLGNDLSYYNDSSDKRRPASSSVRGRRSSRELSSQSKPRGNSQGPKIPHSSSGRRYPVTQKAKLTQTQPSQVTSRGFGAPSVFSAAPEGFSSDQVCPGEHTFMRMETPAQPSLVSHGHKRSLGSGSLPLKQRADLDMGPRLSGGKPLVPSYEGQFMIVDCDKDNDVPMLGGEAVPLHMKAGDSRVDSRFFHGPSDFELGQHVPMF